MIRSVAYRNAEAPLEPEQAWAVVRPYWIQIIALFADKGFPELSKARVEMDDRWHDTCRHYAAMATDGSVLCLAPQMADLPPDNIRGLLAHEAGHLIDFAHPGTYWYRPAAGVVVRQGAKVVSVRDVDPHFRGDVLFEFHTMPSKNLRKHLQEWARRGKDEVERAADEIASWILGEKIGYTGVSDCLIQAVGAGEPRPKGLR